MRVELAADAIGGLPISAPRLARTEPLSAYRRTSRRENPLFRSDDTAFGCTRGDGRRAALQMRLRGSGRRCRRVRLGWDSRQHLARSEHCRPIDHAGLHVLRMCSEVSTTRADEVVIDAQLDG